MSFHNFLKTQFVKLGYPDVQGMCAGFSYRFIEACLSGDSALFEKRVDRIKEIGDDLYHKIELVKLKKGNNLTEEDDELLQISAFFDRLALWHIPKEYSDVFNEKLGINQSRVSEYTSIVSSDKIIALGGLAKISSEINGFNEEELSAYFKDLSELIDNLGEKIEMPVAFGIHKQGHMMALTYDSKEGWRFMDINQYPAKKIVVKDTKNLASRIIKVYGKNVSEKPEIPEIHIALRIEAITVKKHLNQHVINSFSEFKEKHPITSEKIQFYSKMSMLDLAAREGDLSIFKTLAEDSDLLQYKNILGFNFLYDAVKEGHIELASFLREKGVNVHQTFLLNETLVHVAAKNGCLNILEVLPQWGLDLNKKNILGMTPVYCAASDGQVLAVLSLIQKNVDLNAVDLLKRTPLHIATQNGHQHVVKVLIDSNCNLDAKDEKGCTAAYYAVEKGSIAILSLLIHHGADITQKFKKGKTLAVLAIENNQPEILQMLLSKHPEFLSSVNDKGFSLMDLALKGGNAETLKVLLKMGVDPNVENKKNKWPIFLAVKSENPDVIDLLKKYNVSLNQADSKGCLPVHLAAKEADADIMQKLIDDTVNVNHQDMKGKTPAHYAIERFDISYVQILGKHGANFNLQDKQGFSPLLLTIQYGKLEFLKEMLTFGGDIMMPHVMPLLVFEKLLHWMQYYNPEKIQEFMKNKMMQESMIQFTVKDFAMLLAKQEILGILQDAKILPKYLSLYKKSMFSAGKDEGDGLSKQQQKSLNN